MFAWSTLRTNQSYDRCCTVIKLTEKAKLWDCTFLQTKKWRNEDREADYRYIMRFSSWLKYARHYKSRFYNSCSLHLLLNSLIGCSRQQKFQKNQKCIINTFFFNLVSLRFMEKLTGKIHKIARFFTKIEWIIHNYEK